MPKYGANLANLNPTTKALLHAGIKVLRILKRLHQAGLTHNQVEARHILVDGSEVRLLGFDHAKKIGAKSKELLREDVWAIQNHIEFKANTPKSDLVQLAKFLLRDEFDVENIVRGQSESHYLDEFVGYIQALKAEQLPDYELLEN